MLLMNIQITEGKSINFSGKTNRLAAADATFTNTNTAAVHITHTLHLFFNFLPYPLGVVL